MTAALNPNGLVLDPPSAVAVARCLISRLWHGLSAVNLDMDAMHHRPCAWEEWDRTDLAAMLATFHEQAEWTDRWGWRDVGVERFRAMTVHEQRQLIRAAQYGPVEVAA